MEDNQQTFRVGAPPTAPAKQRKRRAGLVVALATAAVLAVVVGGGVLAWIVLTKTPALQAAQDVMKSPLEAATDKCTPGSAFVGIGDGGKSMTIRTEGEEALGINLRQLDCILGELKVTDAIRAELSQTRALDGRQDADWGQFHASWRYHPDDGLNMIVTVR